MKKSLTIIILLALSLTTRAQFTTLWEQCSRTANKPAWFGAGTERGIAYGNMGNGERLYVASRNGGNKLKVLNPADGSEIVLGTPFDLSVVTGGTFTFNDIELTSDGVLIGCNMATSAMKLYVWTTEGGAPSVHSLTLPTVSGIRYGDKMTVVGSWNAGTVEVWFGGAGTAAQGAVQVAKTVNQGASWTISQITLSGAYMNTVASTSVAPIDPSGSFYIAGNGAVPRKHDNSGLYIGNSSFVNASFTSSRGALKVFKTSAKEYLAAMTYRPDPATAGNRNSNCYIYDVTNPAAPVTYGFTPLLSSGVDLANASNGDVAIKDNGNGTFTVFVLGTDQGIGAYVTNTEPLPVELSSFTAMNVNGKVELNWSTATEVNNLGFEIERASTDEMVWEKIGFVEGAGNSNSPRSYSFIDAAAAGKISYRLKQIDMDGRSEYSSVVEVVAKNTPEKCELMPNYPNPFNPSTSIKYNLAKAGNVMLKVHDVLGREVAVLVNGKQEAGLHSVTFDASNLTSGMYIARLYTDNFVKSIKMNLVK